MATINHEREPVAVAKVAAAAPPAARHWRETGLPYMKRRAPAWRAAPPQARARQHEPVPHPFRDPAGSATRAPGAFVAAAFAWSS